MDILERLFKIKEQGSSIKTECVAGGTNFVTMAYIIFVQPVVLSAAGMDFGAVLTATCLISAFATIMMGLFSNHPLALAPAMGENFFFAYTVVIAMKTPWQIALGIIFLSGILFLVLSIFNVRELIINAIPASLKSGITVGIGLFIAVIGLKFSGLIEISAGTLKLGAIKSVPVLISIIGIMMVGVLTYFRIRGAILFSILICLAIALATGIVSYTAMVSAPPSIMPTLGKMELALIFSAENIMKYFPLVIVFLFMDVFDTVGTVVGVTQQAGLVNEDGTIPRIKRILLTDSIATTLGAVLGTSTVTTYIESSAGVHEGGRTGLTAVVTGLLFLCALFFEPLAKMIGGGFKPAGAAAPIYPIIAPAFLLVGSLMLQHATRINFDDITEYLPAFLVMLGMPLTFSIADGLAFGFISYPVLKILTGNIRNTNPVMIILGIIFILRYVFL